MIKKIILSLIIFLGLITFAQSENSWIKKKDKSEKVEKVEKKKTSEWIKKKKVKENKKKLKEKVKESKSWITKKSKEKVKDIKEKLKKHKNIDNLPKAELYFAIAIDRSENEEAQYIYGYINSDKKSEKTKKFKFKNNSFYSHNDGIAFFDDNKTTCQIDVLKDVIFNELKGKAIIKCKNKEIFSADINFTNDGKYGKGYEVVFKNGQSGTLEFTNIKEKNIAKLENYKNQKSLFAAEPLEKNDKLNLKITGKYYALLIGNSKYVNWASLKSPKNDVEEIQKVLSTQYNFEKIITIVDGSEKDIMKGFKELSNITTDKDYVLIYYSGHGDNRGINNYWIPVDGEKEFGLGDWINTAEISNYIMEEIPNHHIVLMSDSCYFDVKTKSNQILNDRKSLSYQKLLNRRSIMIVQSGSNEPVLDSNDDKHSMFAKSFINSLKNNENVIRMYDIIEEITLSHSGMRQQPLGFRVKGWGDSGGDFLFVSGK